MALFALFTLVLAALGVVLLAKVFSIFQPGSRRIQEDLKKMKADMDKWASGLVPLTKEEVELFSFNQEKQSIRKGLSRTAKGIFTSIYHEPVLAYSYKEYLGSGRNALLYARTRSREYVYRFRKGNVEVSINDKPVGVMKADSVLYSGRSNRMLARVKRESDELLLPVLVNEREVGNVAKIDKGAKAKLGQRAFEFVKEDMSPEEKEVFLSLGVLEVLEQSLSR
ncbi:MAG: hypothetical protein KDC66_16965 [Phaeodactylibacter sp.]|nr:hypothetical protein [Phaeodactylibacter sp.]MCB9274248.1 hypothetical protein [Lewinellaceae bacterium]